MYTIQEIITYGLALVGLRQIVMAIFIRLFSSSRKVRLQTIRKMKQKIANWEEDLEAEIPDEPKKTFKERVDEVAEQQ